MARLLSVLPLLIAPLVASAEEKDQFPQGSHWEGTRTANGNSQAWSMRITERDAKKATFKGTITIERPKGKQDTYEVSGTAGVNTLAFTSEEQGRFKQSFKGEIKGGEIIVEFKGTGVGGDYVSGKGRLKPRSKSK